MASKRDRRNKTKNNEEDSSPRIDLGFSTLVASLNPADSATEFSTEKISTSNVENAKTAVSSSLNQDIFATLAEAKNWSKLSALAEEKMGSRDQSSNHAATIWWARSQLELGGVPPSILATPVDISSKQIQKFCSTKSGGLIEPELSSPRLKQETLAVLMRLAKRLLPSLTDKYSLVFIERVVDIDSNLLIDASGILTKEVDRLKKMTGRKAQREKRLEAIEGLLAKLKEKASSKPAPVESKLNSGVASATSNATNVSATLPNSVPATPSKVNYRLGLLALAFIAATLWIYRDRLPFFEDAEPVAALAVVSDDSKPEVAVPEIGRVTSINSLDAVLYGIEKKEGNVSVVSADSGAKQDNAPVVAERILEDKKPDTVKSKERIDTQGPVVGTKFYEGVDTPPVDSERSVFGDAAPAGVGGLSTTPREKKNESYKDGRIYRVLSKTKVLSSASYFAVSMAYLDPGARIEVTEKVGQWLKVRSRMGQVGFILAQDAEPIS